MPAPASGPSPSSTSPSTAAPPRWPGARAGGLTPFWAGCTPITRAAPPRSRSAAPAAAVPFLPTARSRTRRGGLRSPAHGRHAAPSRGGSSATLDAAPPGRLGPRALRPGVLSRDDPGCSAPPHAVVEEGQEAAGPGQPGAATSVPRAAPGRAGWRPTRSASAGLCGRGAHPPGRGSRLWLGQTRRALLGRLKLARALGQAVVLRAVPVQRRPGAAVAFLARQWRTHDRSAAPARAEVPDEALIVLWDGAPYHRAQAVREAAAALNITLMPLPGYSPDLMPFEALCHWLREDVTYHHCHASAEDLTRRAADFETRLNRDPFVIADRLWVKDRLDPDEEKLRFSK